MRAPVLITPPAGTPVSLAEAKAHLRVDGPDEDGLIAAYIEAATAHLDGWTGILGRALMPQTWRQAFDCWSPRMALPLFPVLSVEAVTYLDGEGAEQTLAQEAYELRTDSAGAYLCLLEVSLAARVGSIAITYRAGYADAAAVPRPIHVAILLQVAALYEHREASIEGGLAENPAVHALLAPYRRVRL
ncbi:head-tail connector protein [Pseudoroseicyclus sp. H15]